MLKHVIAVTYVKYSAAATAFRTSAANPNGFLKYTHTNPSKLCVIFLIYLSFSLPVHIHPTAPHMPIERSFVLYISSDEKRNIENDINVFYIPFKYTNILFSQGHRNPLSICSPSGFFYFPRTFALYNHDIWYD